MSRICCIILTGCLLLVFITTAYARDNTRRQRVKKIVYTVYPLLPNGTPDYDSVTLNIQASVLFLSTRWLFLGMTFLSACHTLVTG